MSKSIFIGIFFFSISMVTIGLSAVVTDRIVANFPIFFSISTIFVLSLLLMGPGLIIFPGMKSNISKKDMKIMVIQSVFGIVLFRIFFFNGIKLLGALESGIISSLTPVFVALIGYAFFKEKLNKVEIWSIFLSVTGILLLNYENLLFFDLASIIGLVLVLIATLFDGVFIMTGSRISKKINPIYKSIIVMAISLVMLIPFTLYDIVRFDIVSISIDAWGPVLLYGFVANPIIYICLYLGGTRIHSALAGVLTALIPISAIVGSIVVLGSEFHIHHFYGTVIIIASILFVSLSDRLVVISKRLF